MRLHGLGAEVVATDLQALENARRVHPQLHYELDRDAALAGADAVIVAGARLGLPRDGAAVGAVMRSGWADPSSKPARAERTREIPNAPQRSGVSCSNSQFGPKNSTVDLRMRRIPSRQVMPRENISR